MSFLKKKEWNLILVKIHFRNSWNEVQNFICNLPIFIDFLINFCAAKLWNVQKTILVIIKSHTFKTNEVLIISTNWCTQNLLILPINKVSGPCFNMNMNGWFALNWSLLILAIRSTDMTAVCGGKLNEYFIVNLFI